MKHRTIALATLSTALGIAVVEASSAWSAFSFSRSEKEAVEHRDVPIVPPGSLEAHVEEIVRTDGGPVILLRPEGRDFYLPIWVGHWEGRAIARANLHAIRPMTHDFLASTIAELGAEVLHVRVERLRADGVYIGSVTLARNGEIMTLDARPSDAIALALRVDAPIYVAESLKTHMIQAASLR